MSDGGKGSMAGGTGMVLAAYALWGVLPVYWKALGHLPSGAILAHRIIWALATTSLLLTAGWLWRATRKPCEAAPCLAWDIEGRWRLDEQEIPEHRRGDSAI